MKFGEAIELLREGKAITRDYWAGLYVLATFGGGQATEGVRVDTHVVYVSTSSLVAKPWFAESSDLFSEDWKETEFPSVTKGGGK